MGCREGSAAKSVEDEDSFPFPCEWIGCSGNSLSVLDYDSPEDAPPFPEAGSFEPYVQGRMCARPPPARSRELGSSGLASGSGPAGRPAAHMWLQLDLEARARRASRVRTTRIRFGLRLFAQNVECSSILICIGLPIVRLEANAVVPAPPRSPVVSGLVDLFHRLVVLRGR